MCAHHRLTHVTHANTTGNACRYTGKLSGKQDDTVLALQMCMFAVKTFYSSDRYRTYRGVEAPRDISGPYATHRAIEFDVRSS